MIRINKINKKASNSIINLKKPKKLVCFLFVFIFALSLVAYASFFDNRVPQLEIISPLDNSIVSQDVQIEVNAKAYHEIYGVTLNINDDAPWEEMEKISGDEHQGTYVYVWNTIGVPDGQYDLTIKLLDTFGHVSQKQVTITVQNTRIGLNSETTGDYYYQLLLDSLNSKTDFIVETEEIEETFIVTVERTERVGNEVTVTGTLSFDGPLPESFWFNVTGNIGKLLNYEFIPKLPEDSVLQVIENDSTQPLSIQINGNKINENEIYNFELICETENKFDGKIKVGTGTTVVLISEVSLPPIISGYLNATSGEWNNAFKASSDWENESGGNPPFDITAYVMKNSTHIFVAFNVSDSTYSIYGDYAVVYFDVNNDAPPPPLVGDPAIDDHGFGMLRLASDNFPGERQGIGNSTGREGWYDANNKWRYWNELTPSGFAVGFYDNGSYWSIELAIPYEKLGISSPDDVIGIKFLYGDRYGDESSDLIEYVWPAGGGNPDEPTGDLDAEDDTASYGDAYLDPNGPIVWDLTVNPSQGIAGTIYDFTATVTNSTSAEIDSVTIRITLPNNTFVDDITLSNGGTGDIWTGSWDSTGMADSIYYLTVIATDLQPDVSIVNNMAYVIVDTNPPVTTISLDGTIGLDDWYTSNVTVTLTPSDVLGVAETAYSFDNVTWITYTEPFNITTEGSTIVYYNSTDFLGRVEATKNVTIKIDKTPPNISDPVESVDPVEYNVNETVTCSVTEPVDVSGVQTALLWYKIGIGGTWTALDLSGGNATILNTEFAYSDGTIYYYIYGADIAGNLLYKYDGGLTTTNETTAQANPYNVTIQDTTPPVTTVMDLSGTLGENGWYITNVIVTLSASDDPSGSGVAVTAYSLDGIIWNNYVGPFTVFDEGTTTVKYNSTDNAGNIETQQSNILRIDKTAPIILLESPSDGSTVKDNDIIDLNISDALNNLNTTWYNWDGITNITFFDPWQITVSGLSEGLHTLNVFANDTAGNLNHQIYQFEVDNTEPTIILTSPSDGSTVKDSDVIDLDIADAQDNLHVTWYNWDGITNVTFFDPWQITISGLSDGLHTLNVFANDTAGNLDHQIYQFEVDNTPPTIILTSPSNGSTVKDSDVIDLDITDAQDNLHVTW
ncbi:MAG: OmpL47-type beta-barrel domain-containing protein, partial [Promethearchaeota archaeon]